METLASTEEVVQEQYHCMMWAYWLKKKEQTSQTL